LLTLVVPVLSRVRVAPRLTTVVPARKLLVPLSLNVRPPPLITSVPLAHAQKLFTDKPQTRLQTLDLANKIVGEQVH